MRSSLLILLQSSMKTSLSSSFLVYPRSMLTTGKATPSTTIIQPLLLKSNGSGEHFARSTRRSVLSCCNSLPEQAKCLSTVSKSSRV